MRVRRPRRWPATGCPGDPRQRHPLGGRARHRRRGRAAVAARLVAARVRLPRPRRQPALRRAGPPDARPRTTRPSPTGTRTGPPSTTTTAPRIPTKVADEVGRGGRRRRRRATTPWPATQWQRTGTRSNGDAFTVDTLARYHLHDLVHHAHDVSHVTKRVTVASYDAFVERVPRRHPGDARRRCGRRSSGSSPRCPRVRGCWRSAAARAATPARSRRPACPSAAPTSPRPSSRCCAPTGTPPTCVDPLADDLADPERDAPYDGVWASASLVHVRREDLPTVLRRLAGATRAGGVLHLALKEGDGARFSTHGHVDAPRHFTFWREEPLRAVLEEAGWVGRRGRPRRPGCAARTGSTCWPAAGDRRARPMRHTEFWARMEDGARAGVRPVLGRASTSSATSAAAPRTRRSTAGVPPRRSGAPCGQPSSCPPVDR